MKTLSFQQQAEKLLEVKMIGVSDLESYQLC